jgi:hypothetical protein
MVLDFELPSPKTVCVAVFQRSQALQTLAAWRKAGDCSRRWYKVSGRRFRPRLWLKRFRLSGQAFHEPNSCDDSVKIKRSVAITPGSNDEESLSDQYTARASEHIRGRPYCVQRNPVLTFLWLTMAEVCIAVCENASQAAKRTTMASKRVADKTKRRRWIASVKTDSTHPPAGLFTKSASTIARVLASKKVSPKGPGSGMRMLTYFINRAGRGLAAERQEELKRAKVRLSKRIKRQGKARMRTSTAS